MPRALDDVVQAAGQKAWLALGGNIGDVKAAMRRACIHLEANFSVKIVSRSKIYRTPPWGPIEQDSFLNAVLEVETTLDPRSLLEACLETERALGRERTQRWGPRTLDIDLLMMERGPYNDSELQLPHPRMLERAFVLVPLADIASDMIIDGRSVAAWIDKLDSDQISPVGLL